MLYIEVNKILNSCDRKIKNQIALDNSVCRDMIRLISLPTCVSVLFLQDRISYALQSMPNLSGKERGPHARVQKM